MDYTLKVWLTFGISLCIAILIVFVVWKSYKYIRGLVKRCTLVKKIKKICKTRGYDLSYDKGALLSVLGASERNEMRIVTGEKEYRIKFIAALKRKDTYTFTDVDSYYTSNNFNPVLLSHGHPAAYMVMNKSENKKLRLPFVYQAKNSYIKTVCVGASTEKEPQSGVVNILCVNPVPIKLEIVRTNRPEQAFDGDMFKGYSIYSGQGLCKLLGDI